MAKARKTGELRVGATEFKATCLQLMDRVERTRETVVITKHGRPVARLVPPDAQVPPLLGCMAGTVTVLGDIVSPLLHDYEPPDFPAAEEP